jgi:hypothetical protein
VTQNQKDTYRNALKEARTSFDRAKHRRAEITLELNLLNDEIGRLRRTITALAAMCSESPGLDNLGITDACMEAMENTPFTVSTADVVSDLEGMGFDIASQKNANASVHAVLSRLAKSGKITKIEIEGDKVAWRGPLYDESMDSGMDIPF